LPGPLSLAKKIIIMSAQLLLFRMLLLLMPISILCYSPVQAQDTIPPADTVVQVPATPEPPPAEALQQAQEALELKDKMLEDTQRRLAATEDLLQRAEDELHRQGRFGNHWSRNNNDIKTLAGSRHHSGGFGSLVFKSSSFRDDNFVTLGVRGGWIVTAR